MEMSIARFVSDDFTTRSNDVEGVCRRINPDDWDGDEWFNNNGMGDYLARFCPQADCAVLQSGQGRRCIADI